ncbi:MAG: hypothetical protein HOV68_23695 [Streptomycetaceae bacterium]|nr:hypothetical protein [Streptomycetaceae bacterium]
MRWAPRGMCPACGGFEWRWHEVSGRGTVASWTVSHRSFQPGREAPYVVLLVRLAEASDVLMPGAWGGSAEGLSIGLPVHAEFEDLPTTDDGAWALLHWRPAG